MHFCGASVLVGWFDVGLPPAIFSINTLHNARFTSNYTELDSHYTIKYN